MDILHDEQERKFYCPIDDRESHLYYSQVGEKTLDFSHTYVPPSLRGQGIARQLVQEAVHYASAHNFTVIPSCWYVRQFFKRHSEYAHVLQS